MMFEFECDEEELHSHRTCSNSKFDAHACAIYVHVCHGSSESKVFE